MTMDVLFNDYDTISKVVTKEPPSRPPWDVPIETMPSDEQRQDDCEALAIAEAEVQRTVMIRETIAVNAAAAGRKRLHEQRTRMIKKNIAIVAAATARKKEQERKIAILKEAVATSAAASRMRDHEERTVLIEEIMSEEEEDDIIFQHTISTEASEEEILEELLLEKSASGDSSHVLMNTIEEEEEDDEETEEEEEDYNEDATARQAEEEHEDDARVRQLDEVQEDEEDEIYVAQPWELENRSNQERRSIVMNTVLPVVEEAGGNEDGDGEEHKEKEIKSQVEEEYESDVRDNKHIEEDAEEDYLVSGCIAWYMNMETDAARKGPKNIVKGSIVIKDSISEEDIDAVPALIFADQSSNLNSSSNESNSESNTSSVKQDCDERNQVIVGDDYDYKDIDYSMSTCVTWYMNMECLAVDDMVCPTMVGCQNDTASIIEEAKLLDVAEETTVKETKKHGFKEEDAFYDVSDDYLASECIAWYSNRQYLEMESGTIQYLE